MTILALIGAFHRNNFYSSKSKLDEIPSPITRIISKQLDIKLGPFTRLST